MIYADNAATTELSRAALDAMMPYLTDLYGNPSSVHRAGQAAARALTRARETVARCIGCSPKEIYFTSGGSESDTQAILSAAETGEKQGKRQIISTAFEHHAVLHTLEKLKARGFEILLLPVGERGTVTAEQVEDAVTGRTCLVSVMSANNEIGSVLPVGEIGRVCRAHGVPFHTDAVQAAGQLPIDVRTQNIDMLSLSAHKFHGPKGAGVLYAKSGLPLTEIIEGGAQERGKRAGTENVPAIVGMAAALGEATANLAENTEKMRKLRDFLIAGLAKIPHGILNGDPVRRLPGNVSFCFEGVRGEELLLLLDARGIACSSGSACTAGAAEPSHVLLALGRSPELARGALRISLCASNTEEEAQILLRETENIVALLRGRASC